MELSFDIRGNLKPYKVIEVSKAEFYSTFVESFDEKSSRHQIFENYEKYMSDLSKLAKYNFHQLIDGSFITTKNSPRDIDIVTILDYRDYESKRGILERDFSSIVARTKYKVDAYIMASYPENHKKNSITKSDFLYWTNLFGKTRLNRAKKQYEKGIIRINY